MSVQDELRSLEELHQSGGISDADFEQRKSQLLASPPTAVAQAPAGAMADQQTRQWAMFLHLSQLAGYVVPFAGLIAPIVIWQIKKAEMPAIDEHGKIVANWIISAIIYFVVSAILTVVVIGLPLLIVVGVLAVVFPIIGGIKANNGEVWRYPLSIQFLK